MRGRKLDHDTAIGPLAVAAWSTASLFILLGLAELFRPGFLAPAGPATWTTILGLGVSVALTGALLGTGAKWLRGSRGRPRSGRSSFAPTGALLLSLGFLLSSSLVTSVARGKDLAPPRSDLRVIVLGVDGASLDQIEPMIERGELPHFARLASEGVLTELTSDEPTLSPRVWTTIATGVRPALHGARDFLATQESIRVPRLWETVAANGGRIGLFGWLLTWPPAETDGFVVPGWLARGSETWPPELDFFQRLRGEDTEGGGIGGLVSPAWRGYLNGLRLETLSRAAAVKLWTRIAKPSERESTPHTLLVQSEMATDLFLHWLDRTDAEFSALVLYAVDTFSHRYWGDFDPESVGLDPRDADPRFRGVLPSAYRQADRALGRVLRAADERTVVLVVSDHGSGPGRSAEQRYSLSPERLAVLFEPTTPIRAFAVTDRLLVRPRLASDRDRVEAALRSADIDGVALFDVNVTDEDFFEVDLSGAPDHSATATVAGTDVALAELVVESEFTGGHTVRGILGAWGPGIDAGSPLRQASLVDVTPTALALMGYPIHRHIEGRVLEELLTRKAASALAIRRVPAPPGILEPVFPAAGDEMNQELRERLRALGYLE